MPSIPSGPALQPRGLSGGAKAGVSVGTIFGCIFIAFCLWPFIARCIRRRRRRHACTHSEPLPVAESWHPEPMTEAQHESDQRRMSRDSYGLGPGGRPSMHRQSTKDLTIGSFDGADDLVAQPPLAAVAAIPTGLTSESPTSAPPRIETDLARMVASCESRGYSSSYYNTDIPTEAFGITEYDDKRVSRSGRSSSKFSAASILDSVIRRATTSKTTSASTTHPGEPITALGISESPTELEPPSNVLSRSSRSSGSSREGDRALDLGGIDFPPSSPPPAPPAQPPPGTVNPMEVMGATTTKEQTWRTNAELMNLTTSPASHSLTYSETSPDSSQNATSPPMSNGYPTADPSSQSPEPEERPSVSSPYPVKDYIYGGGQVNDQASAPPGQVPEVFVKDEAFDAVPPLDGEVPQYSRHRYTSSGDIYHTDNSNYSTPFPAPSPSGASTLNTPDTRVTDSTPSPKPVSPEVKHGSSPNSGLSASPQTPQVLVCSQCKQKFDQPHKLKYVLTLKLNIQKATLS